MKYLTFILCIIALNINIDAQNRHRGGMQPQKRINQLEKVKLLEVLELDDEKAVKFFSLKDQHEKNMADLREKQDEILDDIEETLSADESKRNSSLNTLIADFDKSSFEMMDERNRFLKELRTFLPAEKFARFIVFERNFKAEIRDLIMGERMRRRGNP